MQIPCAVLLAVLFSVPTFAAPLPTALVGDELALEARATKAKPVAKPVAKAPVKAAAKPVAKAPVKAAAAKAPVKAAPKAAPAPAKKPAAAPAKKPAAAPAKKPAAAPAKKPAAAPAKKPVAGCPPAKAPAKPAGKPKRMLEALSRDVRIASRTLFGLIQPRVTAGNEFIGWHGTNENTAKLWESSGEIVRPVTKEGQTAGRSGLDAELGAGLYISDTLSVAEAAAAINAQTNKLKGKVCAIFARSSVNWRGARAKVQIPELLRGNAAVKEQERQSYITNVPGKVGRVPAVLLGPLTGSANQMMIIESLNANFEAQCFDITGLNSAGAAAFEKAGNKVSYTSAALIRSWGIAKEDAELAKATVAAIEKKC